MATLILTITGPFAYIDNTYGGSPAYGYMTLMAPMCPQHKGGIAAIEEGNQYIFEDVNCRNHTAGCGNCSPHVYQLMLGLKLPPSSEKWGSDQVLRPPKSGTHYDPKQWRFWLTLPRPDCFEAINPVYANIIRNNQADSDSQKYAIGVRFQYNNWDGGEIPLYQNGQPVKDPRDPNKEFALKFTEDTDLAIVELDYAGPERDDLEHEDAVNCFENLMNALGFQWSIYIPKLVPKGQLLASKLNDCKAAIAWVD